MVRIYFLLLAAVALSGCLPNPKGEGPILISKRVERGFEKYKELSNPTYFAVAENGRFYGYSYCSDTKCRKGGQHVALRYCKENAGSIPCRIFARGDQIVWDGPVSYEY